MAARVPGPGGGRAADLRTLAAGHAQSVKRHAGRGHRRVRLRARSQPAPGTDRGRAARPQPGVPVHIRDRGRRTAADRAADGCRTGGRARADEACRPARGTCLPQLDQGLDLGRGGGRVCAHRDCEVALGGPLPSASRRVGHPRPRGARVPPARFRSREPFGVQRRAGSCVCLGSREPAGGWDRTGCGAGHDLRPRRIASARVRRHRRGVGAPPPHDCSLAVRLRPLRGLSRGGFRSGRNRCLQRQPSLPLSSSARGRASGGGCARQVCRRGQGGLGGRRGDAGRGVRSRLLRLRCRELWIDGDRGRSIVQLRHSAHRLARRRLLQPQVPVRDHRLEASPRRPRASAGVAAGARRHHPRGRKHQLLPRDGCIPEPGQWLRHAALRVPRRQEPLPG